MLILQTIYRTLSRKVYDQSNSDFGVFNSVSIFENPDITQTQMPGLHFIFLQFKL